MAAWAGGRPGGRDLSGASPAAADEPAQVWQDLRSGGLSCAGSRQYLADTKGDGLDDLVTVHQQAGNPVELVWRHVSTGSGLAAPLAIADLRSGGWTYLASRDGVARISGWANF